MPGSPVERAISLNSPLPPMPAMSGSAALALLFPAGSRPTVADIVALLDTPDRGIAASIGHRRDRDAGSMEVIVNGLAFELSGLAPADPVESTGSSHAFGFAGAIPRAGIEAIQLAVSGHVLAGMRLAPVQRGILHLAANLSLRLHPVAVIWHPASTMLEPRHFARIVYDWLAGGGFPALGLAVLVVDSDGSIASRGLEFFTGQEIRMEGRAYDAPGEAMGLATRAIDWLVRHGTLEETCVMPGGPEILLAEPSLTGRHVWVWRMDG